MTIELTTSQQAALRRAAINGDYHLFLGAGASRDSRGRSNEPLPGSRELIQLLSDEFQVPVEPGDHLWRVYSRAVASAAGHEGVYQWFHSRFWNVIPPYWMEYYARTPWAIVWTLNIDDTFEAAYAQIATDVTRKLVSLNWDSPYRLGRELNVVHLHGLVDTAEPRQLVFSLTEYANSNASRASWPLNFRDTYGVYPFVILGATLRDEPDIEAVVSQRNPKHPAPSFYVSKDISYATEKDMQGWGLIPVRMTAEDFAVEWAHLTGIELDHTPSTDLELGFRIGRQMWELRTNETTSASPGHDFIGGDEPEWQDILGNLPADLDWIRSASDDASQVGGVIPPSSILVYVGRRLTGRTTGLLMLAREYRARSWRTFLYRGEGRPDVEAIRRYAAGGKSVAIFFDGLADIADDVDRLVRECRSAELKVTCVGVEDVDNEANLLGRISQNHLAYGRIASIRNRLSQTDAAHLVDRLEEIGRLGFLEAEKDDRRRRRQFINREIFEAMSELENAPGFGRRVEDEVAKLETDVQLHLVLLSAFASKLASPLLVIDAARMVDVDSDALLHSLYKDHQLGILLRTDGTLLKTRQRWMALDPAIERLGGTCALNFLGDALRRLAPRVSRESQIARNSTSALVGRIMAYRNLITAFPDADLDAWYESLRELFGTWSGRYWEQRAILLRRQGESDQAKLSKAESYALRAAELVPDAYSKTTLGTVLLAKAAHSPQIDVLRYYERGLESFRQAAQLDPDNLVGWLAFLRYALPVLRRSIDESLEISTVPAAPDYGSASALSHRISEDWLRVSSDLDAIVTSSDTTKETLTRMRASFRALAR